MSKIRVAGSSPVFREIVVVLDMEVKKLNAVLFISDLRFIRWVTRNKIFKKCSDFSDLMNSVSTGKF